MEPDSIFKLRLFCETCCTVIGDTTEFVPANLYRRVSNEVEVAIKSHLYTETHQRRLTEREQQMRKEFH